MDVLCWTFSYCRELLFLCVVVVLFLHSWFSYQKYSHNCSVYFLTFEAQAWVLCLFTFPRHISSPNSVLGSSIKIKILLVCNLEMLQKTKTKVFCIFIFLIKWHDIYAYVITTTSGATSFFLGEKQKASICVDVFISLWKLIKALRPLELMLWDLRSALAFPCGLCMVSSACLVFLLVFRLPHKCNCESECLSPHVLQFPGS